MATAKLQRGGTLETSVQAAVDEWQQLGKKLAKTADEQDLRISDTISEHLVGVVVDIRTTVLEALVVHVLSETAKQHRLRLDSSAKQLLEPTVHKAVEHAEVQHPVRPVEVELAEDWDCRHPEEYLRRRRGVGKCTRVRDVRERASRPQPHEDHLPDGPLERSEKRVPYVADHPNNTVGS